MPWEPRTFKGKQVWVEVDAAGQVVLNASGLVPMRYQNDDAAKIYNAHPRNIDGLLPEGGDAQPAGTTTAARNGAREGTKKPAAPITSAGAARSSREAAAGPAASRLSNPRDWGPKVISDTVPDELVDIAPPPDGIAEVHTDGACSGNPGPCGYGVVIRIGDRYQEINQYLGTGTNNIGELMAIKVALESLEDRSQPVKLYTDSTYCIGVLTQGWKAKANVELIADIKRLLRQFDRVELIKVKGHAGHPLNERADTLATGSLEHAASKR